MGRLVVSIVLFVAVASVLQLTLAKRESYRLTFNLVSSHSYAKVHPTIGKQLREFTICYWARVHNYTSRTVLSYAMPKRYDEIWTGIEVKRSGDGSVFFHRQSQEKQPTVEKGVRVAAKSLKKGYWAHVCVTWSVLEGKWQVFLDGTSIGSGRGLAENFPAQAGGIAILAQDQDDYGGNFTSEDAFRGDISELHMWDYLLCPEEINQMFNCTYEKEGNVISWNRGTFELYNRVELAPVHLPCSACQ